MLTDLNSLEPEEIKSFAEFIHSPYFNKSEQLKKLFYYLENKYPKIASTDISKEKISANIFNTPLVNDVRIRKLESEFNKIFEKFLIHESIKNKKIESQMFLLEAFRKKLLYKSYEKKISEIEKYSDNEFGEDELLYLNKSRFYHELFIYSESGKIKARTDYEITYLNLYFVFQSLVFHLNSILLNGPEPKCMIKIKIILDFIKQNERYFRKNHPDIIIFYYVVLMKQNANLIYLKTLDKYCSRKIGKLDENLMTIYYMATFSLIYGHMENNPTKKSLTRAFNFINRIHKEGHLNLYLRQGFIVPRLYFFKILNLAINLKKFDWAEEFTREYGKYMNGEYRDNMINVARLILNVFRKEYSEALVMLNNVNKLPIRIDIYIRYIKLMILYELGDFQTFHYEAQATNKYLQRLKTDKQSKTKDILVIKSLVPQINVIARIKEGRLSVKGKQFSKLKAELSSDMSIAGYKFWFLEKLKELEKGG